MGGMIRMTGIPVTAEIKSPKEPPGGLNAAWKEVTDSDVAKAIALARAKRVEEKGR